MMASAAASAASVVSVASTEYWASLSYHSFLCAHSTYGVFCIVADLYLAFGNDLCMSSSIPRKPMRICPCPLAREKNSGE